MIHASTFQIPYFVISLTEHQEIKESLLEIIDSDNITKQNVITQNQNIHKTDYFLKNKDKLYYNIIMPLLEKSLRKCLNEIEYDKLVTNMSSIWYQQYNKLNYHNWHDHGGARWSVVYYVELDPSSPGTQFKDCITSNPISPNVKEGDVIIFPGWMLHRSSPNLSRKRKTIISCNFFYIVD